MTTSVFYLATLLAVVAPAFADPACESPKARQFDFWIGEWDVLNRYRVDEQGWVEAGRATNKVFAILDGCAIVELWDGYLGRNHFRGFSVRAFDPEKEAWVLLLNWPAPDRPSFSTLQGAFRHGRGDFFREGADSAGNPVITRFTFSDVTPRSLRWNDGISRDGGRSWETRWIMEFTRRDPITDLPLVNVPLPSRAGPRLCDSGEAREFDFVLGSWKGEDSVDHPTVSVESLQILDGCASMDFVEIQENDETNELFLVRAYDPSLGRWVLYSIGMAEPTFRRYEGSVDGDRTVLTSVGEDANDARHRLAWSVVARDTLRLEVARSEDQGRTWETRHSTLIRTR